MNRTAAIVLDALLVVTGIVFVALAGKADTVYETGVGWDGPGFLDLEPARVDASTSTWFIGIAVLCGAAIVVAHVLAGKRAGAAR